MADLYDLAAEVLAAVEAHYSAEAATLEALPGRRYVSDGLPAWDCDQVTVRVVRTFGIQGNVLQEQPSTFGGLYHRAAELEVEIVRCTPTVAMEGDEVVPPDPVEIEASAETVLDDAEAVPLAIRRAHDLGALGSCSGVVPLGWTSRGPEGGLVGGTLLIRVDLAGS